MHEHDGHDHDAHDHGGHGAHDHGAHEHGAHNHDAHDHGAHDHGADGDHAHHHDHGAPDVEAPILVTINPEARVSVERTAAPLGPFRVGTWDDVPIAVLNEGFVTGALAIRGEAVSGIELDLPELELSGARLQFGGFRVRFLQPAVVDVTLRFWAMGALGGLANKNTLSLLLRAPIAA